MDRLLRFYLSWHGRLEWINRRFDQGGTRRVQKLVHNSTAIGGIIYGKTHAAARVGEGCEIDGMQINTIFWVAQKNHLFPFDLPKRVVLNDDDFDRQLVLYSRNEVRHQHREPAVPDKPHTLTIRKGDLRGDGVGQTRRHRGEIP